MPSRREAGLLREPKYGLLLWKARSIGKNGRRPLVESLINNGAEAMLSPKKNSPLGGYFFD